MYVCMYVYICICMYVCMYVFICMYVCMYVYVYMYICCIYIPMKRRYNNQNLVSFNSTTQICNA